MKGLSEMVSQSPDGVSFGRSIAALCGSTARGMLRCARDGIWRIFQLIDTEVVLMVRQSGFAPISQDLSSRRFIRLIILLPVVDQVESVEVRDTLTDTEKEWCVASEAEPQRRVA